MVAGIAGVVFVQVALDLADEVRAHVRRLGVNAAAQPGEHADQARPQRQADRGC